MERNNLLIAQSGGPTAAINATLAGAVEAAKKDGRIGRILGGFNGIQGILQRKIVDIGEQIKTAEDIERLSVTPAMALRSCRFKMKDSTSDPDTYEELSRIFKEYGIGYFLYIGGNDSMDTADKLGKFFKSRGEDIKIIGVPKTIDNDLVLTDHTPGFGSALKYVTTTIAEVLRDTKIYAQKSVVVLEIMGRDAGWLTAGSGIAQLAGGAPHLIYIPEIAFDADECIASINDLFKHTPHVVIAVSEGIRRADGSYVHTDERGGSTDAFGHQQLSGAGHYIESLIQEKIGCKVRSIELSVLQRAAGHCLSATDIDESMEVGRAAVALALSGESGKMAAIERISDSPYQSKVVPAELSDIAEKVRAFPTKWMSEGNSGLTEVGMNYFLPLIAGEKSSYYKNGLPNYFVIEDIFVEL